MIDAPERHVDGTDVREPAKSRALQRRVEVSLVGRVVLSVALLFTSVGLVTWNLPGSALKDRAAKVFRPFFNTVGLDQGWEVFAPDPRSNTTYLVANLRYADGTDVAWKAPTGDAAFAPYRMYRWQKWTEYLTLTDEHELWDPAARWIAANHPRNGRLPVEVILTRDWIPTPAPGLHESPQWHHDELYDLRLAGAPPRDEVGL